MLSKCFYLIVALTTLVTVDFSNVSLFPDGTTLDLGGTSLKVRNVVPEYISLPALNFNVTSTEINLSVEEPVQLSMRLEAHALFTYVSSRLVGTLSGSAHLRKEASEGCTSTSTATVMESCDMKMTVSIRSVAGNLQLLQLNVDMCDTVKALIDDTITPQPDSSYPSPTAASTALASSMYFKKYAIASSLGQFIKAPAKATFIQKNVMRFMHSSILPFAVDFDAKHKGIPEASRLILGVAQMTRRFLKMTNPSNTTQTIFGLGSGTAIVTMETLHKVLTDIAAKDGTFVVKAYVPSGATLRHDLVVNDLRCKALGLICTIPRSNAIQVVNSRISGLGDVSPFVNQLLSPTIDSVIQFLTNETITVKSVPSGNVRYLTV